MNNKLPKWDLLLFISIKCRLLRGQYFEEVHPKRALKIKWSNAETLNGKIVLFGKINCNKTRNNSC